MNASHNSAHSETVRAPDRGLACLATIARFHGVAADVDQLRHAAGLGDEPCPPQTLVLSARSLGLKARIVPLRVDALARTPLPALVLDRDGQHCVLARVDGKSALVMEAHSAAATVLPLAQLAARATGRMILFASRASVAGELARFDFSWFIPAIVRYRRLLL